MKVLAFSDLHLDRLSADQLLEEADSADLVIGAGDFAQRHESLEPFMELLAPMDHKAVYVPGNNETEAALRAATGATVLHGQGVSVGGLSIFGLGAAVPPLPPMAWGSYDLSEDEAGAMLGDMGAVDILVSHSPPKGVADVHVSLGSIGSEAVRAVIETNQPPLVLCGHIHDCWGMEGQIGKSRICNLGPGPTWFEF